MDVLLSDFFYSVIESGLEGISNNDLNSIITTIDYIDTQLSNTNFVLDDPYLSQNEQLVVNNSRLREIYAQFRLLFDVYRIYLEQTGGNTNYTTWLNTRNSSSPFVNNTPANYVNNQNPIWYTARDTDGDGSIDEIAPELDGGGRTQTWATSPTLSAGLYRMLRRAVEPSGGGFSGRTVRKPKNKTGKGRFGQGLQIKKQDKDGLVYVDYYDTYDAVDDFSDFQGGGGWGDLEGVWEEDQRDPRDRDANDPGEDFDPVDPSRVPRRDPRDLFRGSGIPRNFAGTGFGGGISNSGISNVNIPIVPLGQMGAPLSNAINVAPMMAPLNAGSTNVFNSYGAMDPMSSALYSTTATPELFVSAPGLAPRDNPPGFNSSMSVGSTMNLQGAPLGGITATNTKLVNLGNCNPNQILYSFRLREIRYLEPRRFFGFNIKPSPQLEINLIGACPGQTGTTLFSFVVNPTIHYTFSPTSRGEFNIIATPNSTMNSVGKVKYQYYYDLLEILRKIHNEATNVLITPTISVYANIQSRIRGGDRPFVNKNVGVLSDGSEKQSRKEEFFKQSGQISSGFVETLPSVIKQLFLPPNVSPYIDSTLPTFDGMNITENFFFMGRQDTVLSYADVSTSTTVDGIYDRKDRVDVTLTALVASKERGEVESLGGNGNNGTGGNGTGGMTPVSERKIKGSYKGGPYDVSWEFDAPTTRDCSAPSYWTNASTNGPMWKIIFDDQIGIAQYVYPSSLTSQNLIDPNSVNPTDGSVTGNIVNIIRGTLTPKELQSNYGLIPVQVAVRPANPVPIPNNPCLRGIPVRYGWGVERIKRIPIKIICEITNQEINYRVQNSNIQNWLIGQLKSNSSYGARQNPNGELLRTADGYFYVEGTETVSIRGRVPNEPGIEWIHYEDVSFIGSAVGCNPVETVESSWLVDFDNPCGCDEVEILTHYLTYPEITYKNALDDVPITFKSQKTPNQRFPAPAPGTKAANYGLQVGQVLTENRRQKPDCFEGDGIGRLHHPFLYGTDILPGMRKKSIKGLFNLSQSLECYHTSSGQSVSQKEYYYEVTDCDNCDRTAYFAVAYGNWKGSGSIASGYERDDSPSRAIYSQYRLLTLDPHEKYFTFYDGGEENTPDDIYVINYYRNGLSDKLDIGNFEINIAELSGSGITNNVHTGSNVKVSGSNPKILTLIDNSAIFDHEDVCANDDPNYYYDIVSGSLENGIHSSGDGTLQTNTSLTTYGKVYPNLGVIVLDGKKLNVSASFNSVSGSSINGDNAYKLFTAISGAAVVNKPMRARNVKFKTTNHYFVRIPSGEANYSNNPTYVIESGEEKGRIKNICFVDNPMTYITTIGLYNTKRELIAVAKLSKPIKKTRENDILVKIRLNW